MINYAQFFTTISSLQLTLPIDLHNMFNVFTTYSIVAQNAPSSDCFLYSNFI